MIMTCWGKGALKTKGYATNTAAAATPRVFLAPGHGGAEGLGQGGPECAVLVAGVASRHRHQNLPNRPWGRKKTTTR